MKAYEFYEKYWKITSGDGLVHDVPKLDEEEKKIWDLAEELNVPPYVNYHKRRVGRVWEVHPEIQKRLTNTNQ